VECYAFFRTVIDITPNGIDAADGWMRHILIGG
jgi:hypothetical protein